MHTEIKGIEFMKPCVEQLKKKVKPANIVNLVLIDQNFIRNKSS